MLTNLGLLVLAVAALQDRIVRSGLPECDERFEHPSRGFLACIPKNGPKFNDDLVHVNPL